MLKKLTIQNYALIESVDIDFPAGLIIITGETGAGKSILLGALSLLLGSKADAEALKDRSSNCIVEAVFDMTGVTPDIFALLGEAGVDFEEDGELILRRVVSPLGRSRAFINDSPIQLNILKQVSEKIIDIHAQHQHLLLSDANYQLSVLDYFSNATSLLDRYGKVHKDLVNAKSELVRLEEEITKSINELEYKQFQFDKLNDSNLIDGELQELESEQLQLANADEIKKLSCQALDLISPMGVSIVQNLKDIANILRKSSSFVPEYSELADRVESCRIECKDIESEISRVEEGIISSPERLMIVEERISEIYTLFKKYGVKTIKELIELKDRLEEELLNSTFNEEKRETLELKVKDLEQQRNLLGDELYKLRESNINRLTEILEEKIKELEMPYAKLEIKLTHSDNFGINGADTVEYLFSANGGSKLSPMNKVASGGELSRIMLCVKALMAEYIGMPTMIFDEVDTGVSGSIADKMGDLIGKMGEKMQIFSITHLPQIAAKGETHLLVYKEIDGESGGKSKFKKLNKQERVMEIARMLSGAELSNAAIDNAKFLLNKKQ